MGVIWQLRHNMSTFSLNLGDPTQKCLGANLSSMLNGHLWLCSGNHANLDIRARPTECKTCSKHMELFLCLLYINF